MCGNNDSSNMLHNHSLTPDRKKTYIAPTYISFQMILVEYVFVQDLC